MFAVSFQHEANTLVCLNFRDQLGADNVFSARIADKQRRDDKHSVGLELAGTPLFADHVTLEMIERRLSQGGLLRVTQFTEKFAWADYQAQAATDGVDVTPLLAIDAQNRLYVVGELLSLAELDDLSKPYRLITLQSPQNAPTTDNATAAAATLSCT